MHFGTFLLMQSPSARPSPEIFARGIEMAQAAESLGFRIPVAVGGLIAAAAAIWLLALETRIAARLEQREPE